MASNYVETESIDRLYLELSQFTKAKTHREILLEKRISGLTETLERIAKWDGEFPSTNMKNKDGNPISWGEAFGLSGEKAIIREMAASAIGKTLNDFLPKKGKK